MNNQVKMLTLADGQQIPQEGFGLYKVHGQGSNFLFKIFVRNNNWAKKEPCPVNTEHGSS
nr:hypothetical protein [Limosilactobacillus pontis]